MRNCIFCNKPTKYVYWADPDMRGVAVCWTDDSMECYAKLQLSLEEWDFEKYRYKPPVLCLRCWMDQKEIRKEWSCWCKVWGTYYKRHLYK